MKLECRAADGHPDRLVVEGSDMAQFAVLKRGSGWEVFRNGSALRRHQTRLDAIEDAYMLAVDVQTVGGGRNSSSRTKAESWNAGL
jgi:hypothetical protein